MTVLATDDFNRADSSLGASWTALTATGSAVIRTNQVGPSVTAVDCISIHSAVAWPADHYSQVVLSDLDDGSKRAGAVVRATDISNHYVGVAVGPLSVGATAGVNCVFRKIVGGVTASLATNTLVTAISGDILRVEAVGTSIKLFVGGVERLSATDANLVGGSAGLFVQSGGVASARLDNWEGGDFAVGGAAVFRKRMLMGVGQ